MKTTINQGYAILILMISLLSTGAGAQDKSLYDFKVKTLYGDEYDMGQLKGKKVLIVNTASKCGFTPQYEDLQELYEKYGGENFEILGFPANNFMNQEPGTNEEIASFCQLNYGVTFQMMEKISVKGDDIHPLYSWLTQKSENGVLDAEVGWNFYKFLIDEEGKVVASLPSKTKPQSEEIISWLEGK
ncbi:MAG: glutathione peroxidase [Bacteroidales bacterium]|nr:glutathione peroxidase [Bacteroidales bacterium]